MNLNRETEKSWLAPEKNGERMNKGNKKNI